MASIEGAQPQIAAPVTQKRILFLWLPLAASWLLMALETPYLNAALARLSEAERMIAAFGLVASLSITIESPVISLLATSTALARSRQNYQQLRRFTLHLMLGTTLIHFLLAWTGLFNVVVAGWMHVPQDLLAPVQLGLKLMLPWSAAIAWRRFKQGVMIRYGQSRYVGQGTLVRLLFSAGTGTLLAVLTGAAGVAVGSLALSAGVLAEATYAHWVARPLVARQFVDSNPGKDAPDLGYAELVGFHWPLAASNLLFLFIQPLIAAALARGPRPEVALAAWPVLNGLLFITRSPEMALPETTIALQEEPGSEVALKRFTLGLGLAASAFLGLVSFTPLADFYFQRLIGVNAELTAIAAGGAALALLMPLAMAFVSLNRGLLTARRITRPMALAMLMELGVLAALLWLGIARGWPGVSVAAAGMTAALAVEAFFLTVVMRGAQAEPGRARIRAWFFRS